MGVQVAQQQAHRCTDAVVDRHALQQARTARGRHGQAAIGHTHGLGLGRVGLGIGGGNRGFMPGHRRRHVLRQLVQRLVQRGLVGVQLAAQIGRGCVAGCGQQVTQDGVVKIAVDTAVRAALLKGQQGIESSFVDGCECPDPARTAAPTRSPGRRGKGRIGAENRTAATGTSGPVAVTSQRATAQTKEAPGSPEASMSSWYKRYASGVHPSIRKRLPVW
jgi:hypothetical protein